jgi:hypothetical protein
MTNIDSSCDSPLYVYELVENILLYLSPRDVVRVSGTCKYWYGCVTGNKTLLRKIHKIPVRCTKGTNPHFIEPNQACRDALFPGGGPEIFAKNVLDLYERADIKLLENAHPEASNQYLRELSSRYNMQLYDCRAAFVGVRYPDGWPVGLREIHCEVCDGFHPQFRFEHVHPLVSFLEDMTLCVRGYGAHLYVEFNILHEWQAPRSCYEHYCAEVRALSERLRWAHTSSGLGDVMFMRPVCSRLVAFANKTKEFHITDNANGITLTEAVAFLIRGFKTYLPNSQKTMHTWLRIIREGSHRLDWRTRRDHRAAFPTDENWKDFYKDFEGFVKMWDDVGLEVDGVMKGIAAWDDETTLWIEREQAKSGEADDTLVTDEEPEWE